MSWTQYENHKISNQWTDFILLIVFMKLESAMSCVIYGEMHFPKKAKLQFNYTVSDKTDF